MSDNNSACDGALRKQTPEEVAIVYRRLRDLKRALRRHLDGNLLAIEMIKVVIEEGWNTGPRIVGTMKQLGFDGKHAGATLAKNRGENPNVHHWQRDLEGRYQVLHSTTEEQNT
jgi:hypothetical protein